jgi:hypothetical protein
MFVVASELMGASRGLGYLLIDGQMTGRVQVVIGSIVLFAILGKLTDLALARLSQRFAGWQDSYKSTGDWGTAMLRVDQVSKRFEGDVALHGISLEVARGEIVSLVAPAAAARAPCSASSAVSRFSVARQV